MRKNEDKELSKILWMALLDTLFNNQEQLFSFDMGLGRHLLLYHYIVLLRSLYNDTIHVECVILIKSVIKEMYNVQKPIIMFIQTYTLVFLVLKKKENYNLVFLHKQGAFQTYKTKAYYRNYTYIEITSSTGKNNSELISESNFLSEGYNLLWGQNRTKSPIWIVSEPRGLLRY